MDEIKKQIDLHEKNAKIHWGRKKKMEKKSLFIDRKTKDICFLQLMTQI